MSVDVRDNPDQDRYEISVDGELAGFAQYRVRPGLIAFIHTEVDEKHEGEGLGSQLIRFALDDARARALEVLPFCPFVNAFLSSHPDYLDLVPASRREAFGL